MTRNIQKTWIAILLLLVGCTARSGGAVSPKNPEVASFQKRLDQYLKLQQEQASKLPDLKDKTNAVNISSNQKALALAIQSARAGAKPGDIFSPDITPTFLRLIREMDKTARRMILDGNPTEEGIKVTLKVNQAYPGVAPLSSVPPGLLQRLPELPKTLEYRFVGRHLVLRDAEADLIVDFIVGTVR
ncbi:MAG: hypothetical protein ACR2L2_07755 [Acidobacteriota bacterium]